MLFPGSGKAFLAVSLAFTVSACGGGGGGGGSDDADESRSSLSLDSDGYGTRKAAINSPEEYEQFAEAYASSEEPPLLLGAILSELGSGELRRVGEDEVARQSTNNLHKYACENPGGLVTITDRSTGTLIDLRHTYTDCVLTTDDFGALSLDGNHHYTARTKAGETSESVTVSQAFDIEGVFLASDTPFTLKGGYDWSEQYDAENMNGTLTLRADVLELRKGGSYTAIEDLRETIRLDDNLYSTSTHLRLTSSVLKGYVDYSTSKPVMTDLAQGGCPLHGINRIEGDGVAEVRHGQDTGNHYEMVVEINGNLAMAFDFCGDIVSDPDKAIP